MKSLLRRFLVMVDVFGFLERDPFGNTLFTKRVIISSLGWLTWSRLMYTNKTRVFGTEHLSPIHI